MHPKTLAPALLLAAFAAAPAQAACDPTLAVVEIEIKNMAFVPAAIEVCVGQTVRWTNKEDPAPPPPARPMRHTVTTDKALAVNPLNAVVPEGAEMFDSGFFAPNATFEYTFTVLGEYKYFCRPHERMGHLGTLTVVEPEAPDTPVTPEG